MKILNRRIWLYSIVLFVISTLVCVSVSAQISYREIHKVKKKETVFGIAKEYGITIDQLKEANIIMQQPDFVLKKGMELIIPFPKEEAPKPVVAVAPKPKPFVVGVMLPLHDINGDGRRMVEYYRGMLLACADLKREGHNIEVHAWNLAEGDDPASLLANPDAARCNVIFGPLYSTQVPALSSFCHQHGIKLVIPFSISAPAIESCPEIYQIYQSPTRINKAAIESFLEKFSDTHPVFIDCNDRTSKKGDFTFGLRKLLEERNIAYSITNLESSAEMFMKSFSPFAKNMVILNTGRSPELGLALQKLEQLEKDMPQVQLSLFGYNEWFLYTGIYEQKMRHFGTFIPSYYDFNQNTPAVQRLEKLFASSFNTNMQKALPRFALTGYDQMMFFAMGWKKYGKEFHGTSLQNPNVSAVQTNFLFDKVNAEGGYQNKKFILVHYGK